MLIREKLVPHFLLKDGAKPQAPEPSADDGKLELPALVTRRNRTRLKDNDIQWATLGKFVAAALLLVAGVYWLGASHV